MTDPIADMLTRIRNANTAMHDEVRMPSSKQKVALAKVLQTEGYIVGFEVAPSTKGPGDVLTIQMKYSRRPRSHDLGPAPRLDPRPACVPQGRRRAPRARRPRGRRPVHQSRADDRPRSAQAQGRRRSPLLRVVRQTRLSTSCPRIGKAPVTVPAGVEVIDRRRAPSRSRAPRARSAADPRRDRGRRSTDGVLTCTRPERRALQPRPARAHPQPRQQHGRRRHRRLQEEPRDRRRRLPRRGPGPERPAPQPRLQPPGQRQGARGHHVRGAGRRRRSSSTASTRKSSARSPPTSAASASPSPTRARASVRRRAHPAQGRQGRQEVSRGSHE